MRHAGEGVHRSLTGWYSYLKVAHAVKEKKSGIPVKEKNGRINFTWNINLIIIIVIFCQL